MPGSPSCSVIAADLLPTPRPAWLLTASQCWPCATESKSFSASAPAASNLLHFLVYIPPPEQRPLRIAGHSSKQKANGIEPSSSFTLTSWGGVALHSPEQVRMLPIEGNLSKRIVTLPCHVELLCLPQCKGCCATSAKSTGNETSAGPCSRHRQMGEQELTDLARVLVTQLRHALQLQDADGMVVATQGTC